MYESPEHLPPVRSSELDPVLLNAGDWPVKPIKHIYCRLALLLNTTDISPIHESKDPEAKVSSFTSIISSILDQIVSLKKISITNNDMPWMTVQIKALIKDQCAFCSADKSSYKNLKSIIAKKMMNAKKPWVEEL